MAASRSQRLPAWLKVAFAVPNALYRNGFGWLLGHRMLQLEHVGRRSGQTRHTVLEVVGYDPVSGEAVVVSGFGPTADWYRNVVAGGPVAVSFGRGVCPAAYRALDVAEAERVLAAYEHRNRLARPVLRWALSSLLGRRYDGTPQARRTVVAQLPLVALRPRGRGPTAG